MSLGRGARRRWYARAAIATVMVAGLIVGIEQLVGGHHGRAAPTTRPPAAVEAAAPKAPTSPPAVMCGNTAALNGPATAPAGAVVIPAGNNSAQFDAPLPANKTYWFAPGTHTLGSSEYSQINPGINDTFIGGPGAILDGQKKNDFAFIGNYQAPYTTGVVIEHLTIEHFTPPGSQGVINENSNPNWTILYNTIAYNVPGSAIMLGTSDVVEYNCLTQNGQYAFNGYSTMDVSPVTHGPMNITLSHNEISYNNTCNWEAVSKFPITPPAGCANQGEFSGCGCAGGGKFWQDQNVTVNDNWVHGNYDIGLWADTNNDGFLFQGNWIANNKDQGLMYEVSYNAHIVDNTFVSNGIADAPTAGFPTGAIYISESGGDSRVPNSFGYATITISGNQFTNNWDAVVLWENANRFCGDNIFYNEPDDGCTLVAPTVASSAKVCAAALANPAENQPTDNPDYFGLCRWKVKNVSVTGNNFTFSTAALGSQCTAKNYCGMNALFSEYGGAPYPGEIVPTNITFNQNNLFANNTYTGPWKFIVWSDGNLDNPVSPAVWQKPVTDKCGTSGEKASGTCNSGFGQDKGSTFH
jgi:Right handed beta helix region